MANISSETLFHYTKNIDNLVNILRNGFYPRYCPESIKYPEFTNDTFPIHYVVPMVCFCDIPLSQTHEHTQKYHKYSIGLTKQWGYEKGITPVTYFPNNSVIIGYSNDMYHVLQQITNKTLKEKALLNWVIQRFGYFKSEKGAMWDGTNKEFKKEIEHFYNEREWRHIPINHTSAPANDLPFSLYMPYEEYKNLSQIKYEELIQQLNTRPLRFRPKEIQHIIVSQDNEIPYIIDEVEKIMKEKHNINDEKAIKLMITKITSMERIRKDY